MAGIYPPRPTDTETSERWDHTRLRRRILYGKWEADLTTRMRALVGTVRQEAWGKPDMSANPFRALCAQLATLYDRPPKTSHADDTSGEAAEALDEALEDAGLWSLMQRVQRDTIGLREMIVRVDTDADGELVFLPAYPDLVRIVMDPRRPRQMQRYEEAQYKPLDPEDPSSDHRWVWEVIEIIDGVGRRRFALDKDGRPSTDADADVSSVYLEVEGAAAPRGGQTGEAYPYLWADGTPFIPAVLYHAAVTGCVWDTYEAQEAVEATLNVGVYWSFWGHILKTSSWPQRYAAGVRVAGTDQTGGQGARTEMVTDPATVVFFDPIQTFEGQPVIGQWKAGGDPVAIAGSIASYERRIIAYLGISPSDLHRVSGDPRSGYAIAITKEAQRESSRRLQPSYQRSDRVLMSYAAALLNRWAETQTASLPTLPEKGWRTKYEGIPLSAEERRALREEAREMFDQGLIDKVDFLARIEGLSREEARRRLAAIEASREESDPSLDPPPRDEDGRNAT